MMTKGELALYASDLKDKEFVTQCAESIFSHLRSAVENKQPVEHWIDACCAKHWNHSVVLQLVTLFQQQGYIVKVHGNNLYFAAIL